MSKTIAEHSAAYRKRRADKIARYEAALIAIYRFPVTDPLNMDAQNMCKMAWSALNGRPGL